MATDTHKLKRFYVRCSEVELELYKAEAARLGVTLPDYVRAAMTYYRGVQDGLRRSEKTTDV